MYGNWEDEYTADGQGEQTGDFYDNNAEYQNTNANVNATPTQAQATTAGGKKKGKGKKNKNGDKPEEPKDQKVKVKKVVEKAKKVEEVVDVAKLRTEKKNVLAGDKDPMNLIIIGIVYVTIFFIFFCYLDLNFFLPGDSDL